MAKKEFHVWDWVVIKDWDTLYNRYYKETVLKRKYMNKTYFHLQLPNINFLYEMRKLCGKLACILEIHSEYFKLWFWNKKFDTGYLFTKEMFMTIEDIKKSPYKKLFRKNFRNI